MLSDERLAGWVSFLKTRLGSGVIDACPEVLVEAFYQFEELRQLRLLASAAERVVRLRGWTSDAEVHPGRGEAERELVRLVEEWKK